MISAVFDCVTYVQAAISVAGPAAACLSFAEVGHIKLLASPAILAECRETLSQQDLRTRFHTLTDEHIESFLQHIGQVADLVADVPSVFKLPRDQDDALYVDLAAATVAAFIVSRDKDLLDLMKDEKFRTAYPALTILDPVAFLTHVRSHMGNEGVTASMS